MADNLDIFLRFLIDQAAQGNTEGAIRALTNRMKEFDEEIEDVKKSARELQQIGSGLEKTFKSSFLIGTAVTGGIFAAANKYVKDAKEATSVTLAWHAAQ